MIFLNHAGWLISDTKYFDFGARGVEIFFILSGYMMAGIIIVIELCRPIGNILFSI